MIITAILLVIVICTFLEEKRKVPPFTNYVMASTKTSRYRSEPLFFTVGTYFKPVRENDCISVVRMTHVPSYTWTIDGRAFVSDKNDNSDIISSCLVYKLYRNVISNESGIIQKTSHLCWTFVKVTWVKWYSLRIYTEFLLKNKLKYPFYQQEITPYLLLGDSHIHSL